MDYLQWKYLRLLSINLELYKEDGHTASFRCPFCGDSKSNPNARKAGVFKGTRSLIFNCYRCNSPMPLVSFIKEMNPILFEEYIFEKFKESRNDRRAVTNLKVKKKFEMPKFKDSLSNCIAIKDLKEDHFAREYVEHRKIPKDRYDSLYYTGDFKEFVASYFPDYENVDGLKENEKRLIIPFIKEEGNIPIIQGRSFDFNSSLRYITIKKDPLEQKVYGLDRLNKSKQVYVVEGPIDSMFVDNCLASADSTLSNVALSKDDILIHDNEPRNKNICKITKKSIKLGYSVVLFPEHIREKDINDMFLSGVDIMKVIKSNTFSGLNAELRFTTWQKC